LLPRTHLSVDGHPPALSGQQVQELSIQPVPHAFDVETQVPEACRANKSGDESAAKICRNKTRYVPKMTDVEPLIFLFVLEFDYCSGVKNVP